MTATTTQATSDPLIPVRALNQVTYCPRLYYLQDVECVVQKDEHVEGGLFDHRRINAPELANRTRKEGDAAHTRGAAISSERLGLTGVLDLVRWRDSGGQPVWVRGPGAIGAGRYGGLGLLAAHND
jgi:hypothetical protein